MNQKPIPTEPRWYSLGYSLRFMMSRKRLLGWSLLLFIVTIVITATAFTFTTGYIDQLAGGFLANPPETTTWWGMVKEKGWFIGRYLFIFISRLVTFYLAFLLAYCITTPGYVFLSLAAEKIHEGVDFAPDEAINLKMVLIDLIEGIKIAAFGLIITGGALIMNFIPLIGQAVVFLTYTYFSALLFLDFAASRKHWSLGRKIRWVRSNSSVSFRLGVLPALVSMIPILNIFLLCLLFPLLTIHSTLNFCSIEKANNKHSRQPAQRS